MVNTGPVQCLGLKAVVALEVKVQWTNTYPTSRLASWKHDIPTLVIVVHALPTRAALFTASMKERYIYNTISRRIPDHGLILGRNVNRSTS